MNLTTRELRLARQAAARFLPPVEHAKPIERLPVGVYRHASRYRTNIKGPDGKWTLKSYDTAQEASDARMKSLTK